MKKEIVILDGELILKKIKRIAFQILESNFDEDEIILAGIAEQGFVLAQHIQKYMQQISSVKISIAKLNFDKKSDFQPDIEVISDVDTFKNKVVVLVDDVLNSGRTVAFCFRPFLSIPLKKLQVAVLVNREFRTFPIAADYVGYSLSTNLSDYIKVELMDENNVGVFLF